MDIRNNLLEKFFKTFDLDRNGLEIYCKENKIDNNDKLVLEFQNIRIKIFNHIWKITEPNIRLTPAEILHASETYLQANYSWIDENGMKAVNNYLQWICWHEGIMK